MHIEDVEALTAWLIRELKPICDAEPPVLAKYVLSLIRKPDKTDDEIREFCSAQLEVFLQGNTKRFVEKMFVALKDGSYMDQKQSPSKKPEELKIPVPFAKEEKRPDEPKPTTSKPDVKKFPVRKDDVAKKDDVPKKDDPKIARRRISPPPVDAKKELVPARDREINRRRSRSPRNRRDRRRSPERRYRRSRTRSRSGEREHRKGDEVRKRRRCRDYDEKGVCTRGDMCQYDHGPDPVVFDREVMDMMGSLGPKGAPAPNLSVPPPGYNPVNPPPPGIENIYNAPPPNGAPSVEGYNPEAPAMTSANYSVPPPPLPLQMSQAPWRPTPYTVNTVQMSTPVYDPHSGVPVDPASAPPVQQGGGVIRGSRGRGRGRGGHTGVSHFNPIRNYGDGKTIQVSRVPAEQNNITKLNEHFSQFGNIVNIQVRYEGDPECALITFNSKPEATAAIKSPSPVLNNRFIRVNWHRPDSESNTPNSAELSLASGVRVSNIPASMPVVEQKIASVGESKFVNSDFTAKEKAKSKKKELQGKGKALLEAHKKQGTLLASLGKQLKTILEKLRDESIDAETKKRLKDLAKTTSDQINVAKTLSNSLSRQLEENTEALKEVQTVLDRQATKSSPDHEANGDVAASRKRLAREIEVCQQPSGHSSPLKKKNTNFAILVTGFTLDDEEKVTEAMELMGDLLDVEIQPGAGPEVSAIYTYKENSVADKVLNAPPIIDGLTLKVSTAPNRIDRLASQESVEVEIHSE